MCVSLFFLIKISFVFPSFINILICKTIIFGVPHSFKPECKCSWIEENKNRYISVVVCNISLRLRTICILIIYFGKCNLKLKSRHYVETFIVWLIFFRFFLLFKICTQMENSRSKSSGVCLAGVWCKSASCWTCFVAKLN